MENQNYVTLNNGCKIPQFGLGVYMVPAAETKKNCLDAFEMGYRHVDTAHAYQNEREVGAAVKESGIPREEIWITSKLWPSEYGEQDTAAGIEKMLARLDVDYIDLLLLHQQFSDYIGAYKAMEKAVCDGKVRSIGLSNFESDRLEEVLSMATIKPAVLQVECHPYYAQSELKKRIADAGTVIECWYPLGHGDYQLVAVQLEIRMQQHRRISRQRQCPRRRRVRILQRWQTAKQVQQKKAKRYRLQSWSRTCSYSSGTL